MADELRLAEVQTGKTGKTAARWQSQLPAPTSFRRPSLVRLGNLS